MTKKKKSIRKVASWNEAGNFHFQCGGLRHLH